MAARAEQLINIVRALDPRAGTDDVILWVVRFARSALGAAGVVVARPDPQGFIEVRAGDIAEHGRETMRQLFDEAEALRRPGEAQVEHVRDEHRILVRAVPDDEQGHVFALWFVDEDEDDADDDRTLTVSQSTTVDVLVDLVGERLARGRGVAEAERRAVRRERDRIARDMHDVVVQRVFAAGLQVQAVRRSDDPGTMREGLGAVVEDLDRVIGDIRAAIFELDHAAGVGLRDNLRYLVGEYTRVLGFPPVLRTDGDVDGLDNVVGTHVLATVREALSNVARHAGATSCRVGLRNEDGWLSVEVGDDGRGFDPEARDGARRSGLANLHLRAQLLGGELDVRPSQPSGTVVRWRVPVAPAA